MCGIPTAGPRGLKTKESPGAEATGAMLIFATSKEGDLR
jgi:hypothetical protein